MTKFIHQYDEDSPHIEFTMAEDMTYPELLDAFIRFTKAMTFSDAVINKCIKEKAEDIIYDETND